MTKLDLQYVLGSLKPIDMLTRSYHKLTYGYSARDIRNFPILKDTKPLYWPTRKTNLAKVLIEAISMFLKDRVEMRYLPQSSLHDQFMEMIKQSMSVMHEYRLQSSSIITRLAEMATQLVLAIRSVIEWRDAKDIAAKDAEQELYDLANFLFDKYIIQHRDEMMNMEDVLRTKLELDDKLFSEADIEAYRSLASHPVFEFFKFKTMMKYLSTTPEFYQRLGEMYLEKDFWLLRYLIVDDEKNGLSNLKRALHNMPEYQDFLSQHGDFAADLIDKDFQEYADRLQRKIDKHPDDEKYQTYYKNLLDQLIAFKDKPRPANRC